MTINRHRFRFILMKSKLNIFIILQVFLINIEVQAQWEQVADFGGLERDDLVSFTCNERAFAGSGMNTAYQVTNDFYEYKVSINAWQAIANLPGVSRQYAFSFSFNYNALVFAGIDQAGNDLKDGYKYHTLNNSWTNAIPYPGSGSRGCASATINNLGYAGLGRSNGNTMHNDWWQYNLDNNTWMQKASFPGAARNLSACFESNGFIFVVGGIGANDMAFGDVWRYNPINDDWLLVNAPLATDVGNMAHCKVKNSGVLVGGYDGQNIYTNNARQFNAFNSTWIDLPPIPTNGALKGAKAFELNNVLYVTCGITSDNIRHKSTWKYDLVNSTTARVRDKHNCVIYPNPANEEFSISCTENNNDQCIKYEIYDIHGTIVKWENFNEVKDLATSSTASIAEGIYWIKIYTVKKIIHQKLIIKK